MTEQAANTAADDLVLMDKRDDGVAVLTLNRPDALNALSMPVRKRLAERFTSLHDDPDVRCIVLRGSEKAFAAGADLKDMAEQSMTDMIRRRSERYWSAVASTPQPVVAAVTGYALGGGLELAMMCDVIVVGEEAQLGQPEIRVGIMPGAGGTQRLPRAVGKYMAMKMCLTGKPISGREALAHGLASECVPDADVFAAADKIAVTIARMPPFAAMAIKEAIIQGGSASLDAGLTLERKALHTMFATEDRDEGMGAFIEKRRPEFKGK
ncbi:MAG: enoyl-CoA hydratase-related protein [Pseudomonadota bacterium]